MAEEPVEVHEDEERAPALDPETRARRDAALRMVRKYGDPVLRSRALEIDRFDDKLVEEARRMGQVMHDALGIGLAATQVGVSGLDERGDALTIEASGLEARVIQHEMDHLDGVLILDRTPRDQRKQAMHALRERLEAA